MFLVCRALLASAIHILTTKLMKSADLFAAVLNQQTQNFSYQCKIGKRRHCM